MSESKPIDVIAVTLDKERHLRMDWNAMYKAEEALTKRRGGAWVSMQSLGDITRLSIADMRSVIWAALSHEDESLTESQVGAMIHMGNMDYVCEKLAESMDQTGVTESPNGKGDGASPLAVTGG